MRITEIIRHHTMVGICGISWPTRLEIHTLRATFPIIRTGVLNFAGIGGIGFLMSLSSPMVDRPMVFILAISASDRFRLPERHSLIKRFPSA